MQKIDSNVPLMAIIGLIVIVSGCISGQDTASQPDLTQNNSTITTPQLSITAEVETGLVKLNHRGGDDVALKDITIVIEQGNASAIYEKIGQSDDRFVKGDTLYLTLTGVSLNGKALNTGRLSINNSEVGAEDKTIITMIHLPSGNLLARIVSTEGFFG